jgi:hypothetical protein
MIHEMADDVGHDLLSKSPIFRAYFILAIALRRGLQEGASPADKLCGGLGETVWPVAASDDML